MAKTKEELNVIKEEVETLNKKLLELTDEELVEVCGGETWWLVDQKQGEVMVNNPVAGMPREQAEKIAKELDEGTYVGSWSTMTGAQFMDWWRRSNPGME